MSNAIGSKIDDYAKAHVKELKNEEAKTGKSLTKYDIAQLMLAKGALSEKDYGSWMNTSEGAESLKMSTAQKQALQRGNIWGFSGNNQPSYLETLSETDPFGIDFSNKKFDYKEVDAKSRIRALPQVEMSYTELTNSIKFQKMSREEKTEFLLQETGRMFYEAKEKGDKETMKATLLQGLGLTFAYMDEKAGITDVKEFLKEYSGLNAVVDLIDKYVEDGDDANLTFGERAWSAVKGAGDAVDGFIGTQAVAFVGTLSAASAAAASAGIGQIFSAVTTLGFGVQGATMMVEGGAGIVTGDTAEEVREAGAEFTMGSIMFAGAAKTAKDVYGNYKATQNAHAEQVANARKSLGIEDGVELNAQNLKEAFRSASLKNHPDKGGSADAMAEINNAYNILKNEIGSKQIVKPRKNVDVDTAIKDFKKAGIEFPTIYDPPSNANVGEGSISIKVNGQWKDISLGRVGNQVVGMFSGEPAVHYHNVVQKFQASNQSLTDYIATNKLPQHEADFLRLAIKEQSLIVTRTNGTQINVTEGIPKEVLAAPTSDYLNMPAATTVEQGIGITIKQGKATPSEAKRILTGKTVEETLRLNNENGIPLKFEASPTDGSTPYFYKDAPYGGRQKVNVQSLEVTYTHEAEASWGLTPEYMAEYGNNGFAPDRAVVASGNDAKTGIKGNIAEKQYEIVNPDGSRSPLVTSELKPGETVNIIKKEGVELRMAVLNEPTISLEGEVIPAGKPVMIDSEGHPYAGNPFRRIKSGEVVLDNTTPQNQRINELATQSAKLDAEAKAAKKAGNIDKSNELTAKSKELEAEFNKILTENTYASKQSAPSQALPDVVDNIYGNKAEAEAVVFGNGKLSDIKPEIVKKATDNLSQYFKQEISTNDIQVIKTSNGAFISYFDPKTNLATHCSFNGQLNGQFEVTFDANGNINSFSLKSIYSDGRFWRK